MSNQTVDDCEGFFFDSDNGVIPLDYGHNEDLTFSICPLGADSITMVFSDFCTELNNDVLRFFDGPDTFSAPIGLDFSGQTQIPPILATSGCLTIHFRSDASVSCTGWSAQWEAIIDEPSDRILTSVSNPLCQSNLARFTLDQAVACSALDTAIGQVFGPVGLINVVQVNSLNCQGGLTQEIEVVLSQNFAANGQYTINLTTEVEDACGQRWPINFFGGFEVNDCPLDVILYNDLDTVCSGQTVGLYAEVLNASGPVTYTWDPPLPNSPGDHFLTADSSRWYYVTVSDGVAPPGTDSVFVFVIDTFSMPQPFTLCQSNSDTFLVASPPGGYWEGAGVNSIGRLRPWNAPPGDHWIRYYAQGCADSFLVTINPMNIWSWDGYVFCQSSNSVIDLRSSPAGGVFSGLGIVDPVLGLWNHSLAGPGNHVITYSTGLCPDDYITMTVENPTVQLADTLCVNDDRHTLDVNPRGGEFFGNGITNWYWGWFDPSITGPGLHEVFYQTGDCIDTITILVQDIDAGPDLMFCPNQTNQPLVGLPANGQWAGPGILSSNGLFDPNFSNGADSVIKITYSANGCVDTAEVLVAYTRVTQDTLTFCGYDLLFDLNFDNTSRFPGPGGLWSGPGLLLNSQDGLLDLQALNPGYNNLVFSNNTCSDTLTLYREEEFTLTDTIFCVLSSSSILNSSLPPGFWDGMGIVNPTTGLFSPINAGTGSHWINYTSPVGCFYPMNVQVDPPAPQPTILDFDEYYCFKDTTYVLSAMPNTGIWSNAITDSLFNPALLNPGLATVTYTVGSGDCASSSSLSTEIGLPLQAEILNADTAICKGDEFRIEAEVSGGDALNYSYNWTPNQGNVISFIASPSQTGNYTLIASDGCSDPDTANLIVFVKPSPIISLTSSDSACIGLPGLLQANVEPPANYIYSWDGGPFTGVDTFAGQAGDFIDIFVENPLTNCTASDNGSIPAYPRVIADFTSIPNTECLDLLNNTIVLLDQSSEGSQGRWTIGDMDSMNYEAGMSIEYSFIDTGNFPISLHINDSHGCSDSITQNICVNIFSQINAPTAFSPNFDGVNDVFSLKTIGTANEIFMIFNRWGNLLYQSNDAENLGWNGFYNNEVMPIGEYVWELQYFNEATQKQEVILGSVSLIE